jgi:hypothetical protein
MNLATASCKFENIGRCVNADRQIIREIFMPNPSSVDHVTKAIQTDDLDLFAIFLRDRVAKPNDVDRYARSFIERSPHNRRVIEEFTHFAMITNKYPHIQDETVARYGDLAMKDDGRPAYERFAVLLSANGYFRSRGLRQTHMDAIVDSILALDVPQRHRELNDLAFKLSCVSHTEFRDPQGTVESDLWRKFTTACLERHSMHVAYTSAFTARDAEHIPVLYVQGDGPIVSTTVPLRQMMDSIYARRTSEEKRVDDPLMTALATMGEVLDIFARSECQHFFGLVGDLAMRSNSKDAIKSYQDLEVHAIKRRYIAIPPQPRPPAAPGRAVAPT